MYQEVYNICKTKMYGNNKQHNGWEKENAAS